MITIPTYEETLDLVLKLRWKVVTEDGVSSVELDDPLPFFNDGETFIITTLISGMNEVAANHIVKLHNKTIMKQVVWCSIHEPTQEQVIELKSMGKLHYLSDISLTVLNKIANIQKEDNLHELADELMQTIADHHMIESEDILIVQPAGSQQFQSVLGYHVGVSRHFTERYNSMNLAYAFSTRSSKEVTNSDSTVRKVSTFKHEGFKPTFH